MIRLPVPQEGDARFNSDPRTRPILTVMDLVQRNWTIWSAIGTLIIAAALVIGFISVSEPWFFEKLDCGPPVAHSCPNLLPHGLDTAGGALYLFVLANVGLLFMLRLLLGRYLVLPVADWWLYLASGIGGLGAASQSLRDPSFHDSVGFGSGFQLALAAAAAIAIAAFFERTRQREVGWNGRRYTTYSAGRRLRRGAYSSVLLPHWPDANRELGARRQPGDFGSLPIQPFRRTTWAVYRPRVAELYGRLPQTAIALSKRTRRTV